MYTNPDMLGQLTLDHQRQMQREADVERQVWQVRQGRRTRLEQPMFSLRLGLSALLMSLSRSVRPRDAQRVRRARLNRSLA